MPCCYMVFAFFRETHFLQMILVIISFVVKLVDMSLFYEKVIQATFAFLFGQPFGTILHDKCYKEYSGKIHPFNDVFRHGERMPCALDPRDPHMYDKFETPLCALTNKGKQQEYILGQYQRKIYGNFLGSIYSEEIIEIHSTNIERTKMSALLVLAGLWPPKGKQIWNKNILWQPIPVDFYPTDKIDYLLPLFACPTLDKLLKLVDNDTQAQKRFVKPYVDIFAYIKLNSGKDVKNLLDLIGVYDQLYTQEGLNLTLPAWTHKIYPNPLRSIVPRFFEYLNYNDGLKKFNSGYLLKRLLANMKNKCSRTLIPANRKIYLYSAHDVTVGSLLVGLNVFKLQWPAYSSAVFLELYRKDQQCFVKVSYRKDYLQYNKTELIIPGCENYCPLTKFENIIKHITSNNTIEEGCGKAKTCN